MNTATYTDVKRSEADPISAMAVIELLRASGLPREWRDKFAQAVKSATNGAEKPAFSDWSIVRELLAMTMPRSSAQLAGLNVVMEYLQTIENGKTTPEGNVLSNVLGTAEKEDQIALAARQFSLEQLQAKFGADLPALNSLLEDSLFGDSVSVLRITEKDGVIEARVVKQVKG